MQLDVTNVETISAARRAIGEQVGSVDVLVNDAAFLLGESDHVLAISADDYRRTFETNVQSAIRRAASARGNTHTAGSRFHLLTSTRQLEVCSSWNRSTVSIDEAIARVSMNRSVAGNKQERGPVGLQPVAGLGST